MKDSIAIIGAGPAGVACAIQLARYGRKAVVFEKSEIGGLLHNANLVENYLGFPNGISGLKLIQNIRAQFQKYDIDYRNEEIIELDKITDTFHLTTEKEKYEFSNVVIASGTLPRKLKLLETASKELMAKVSYEVYPFMNVEYSKIAIIGGGDAAFDYSLNLAENGNTIDIFHRSDNFSTLPLLLQRTKEQPGISVHKNNILKDIELVENNLKMHISCEGKEISHGADYLIIAIGREPNLSYVSDSLKTDLESLIDNKQLFLIGDVQNGLFRQASIAAADGVKVAMQICLG